MNNPQHPSAPLPETCFLFAYFEANGQDGLHLAWSHDGLKWDKLGQGYIVPSVGEFKMMRDPCLFQGPDGIFRLLWTTGWTGRDIGYAASPDLLHWSPQQALGVMEHEPDAQNSWAPEMVWDGDNGHFLLFWSSTILGRFPETAQSTDRLSHNHRLYSCTTRDFVAFSPTRLHYDGGFNVIDANIVRAEDGWLMFVKDETLLPQPEKNLRLIRAQTPDGPFLPPSPPLTGDYWAEGPSALKVGDEWWVYFDKYRDRKYGLVCSRDLETWDDRSDQIIFPEAARHGSVLRVEREVIERLQHAASR